MIYFQNRGWKILSKFEKLAGFWPYQRRMINYTARIGISFLLFTYSIPLIMRMVKEWNLNFYIILENSLVLSIIISVNTKILSASLLQQQRRKILEQVALHFETFIDDEETDIVKNYSRRGLRFTTVFTATAIICCGLYDGLPLARMYLTYLFGEGTLEKKFPLYIDYLVDEQEYFFYILAHTLISLSAGMVAEFSYDMTFFLTVRHCCALFKIVQVRLEQALKICEQGDENQRIADADEQKAFDIITSAVVLHNQALQLARAIDQAYNVSWFTVLLLNMLLLAPVVLFVLFYLNDLFELFRYTLALILILMHFYAIFIQGQFIIDHSSSVFMTCYDSSWYITPKRTKMAIAMIMMNSLIPCQITGCKMFVLSMETYGKMMKTGLSFVTIFAAFEY